MYGNLKLGKGNASLATLKFVKIIYVIVFQYLSIRFRTQVVYLLIAKICTYLFVPRQQCCVDQIQSYIV